MRRATSSQSARAEHGQKPLFARTWPSSARTAAGLDRLDQTAFPLSNSYSYASEGTGVNVYVIDSGIRITHQEFGGRAFNGWDCVNNDPIAQDPFGRRP